MAEILICTMGLAPGVVMRMAQYLQQDAEPPRHLSEVWVVFPANPTIMDLYNYILRKEFDERLGLKDRHYPKVFSPVDVITKEQVKRFFEELAVLLKEKLTPHDATVHLCISGGRKSMTYATALAIHAVSGEETKAVEEGRFHVWHIQLEREEEPLPEDVQQLLRDYQDGLISPSARERILYPRDARITPIPFIRFERPHSVEQREGRYVFTRVR